jgi:FixJ family two-component response regulator
MSSKTTIFVIDDDSAVRDSLTHMLEQEDFSVETFDSAEAFLTTHKSVPHGCAIIDARMPGMNGMQLQEEISRRNFALPVIFLTGHGDIPTTVKAMKAGAIDFLTKPVAVQSLLDTVHKALLEAAKLQSRIAENQKAMASMQSLTRREREVMTMVAQGLANKEIARQLHISHRTVEQHRASVMNKVGAETLLDLLRVAQRIGLSD